MTVTHQALEAHTVSKRYGHTQALDAVSLTITAGEIHGLVGHNGAGKSTLLRLLSGAERPDSGALNIDGRHLELGSPREANLQGISSVYQELSLIEELTVAQNLFLGRELRRAGRLQLGEMDRQTAKFLGEYGLDIAPTTKVRALTVAQRQLIEVIAALHRNASFLLLDEPTTALEARQVEELLATVRRVADERGVGVLLVDHKLDECVRCCRPGHRAQEREDRPVRDHRLGRSRGRDRGHRRERGGRGCRHGSSRRGAPQGRVLRDPARRDRRAPRGRTRHGDRARGARPHVAESARRLHHGTHRPRPRDLRPGRLRADEPSPNPVRRGGTDRGPDLLFGRPYRPAGCAAAIEAGIAYLAEERKSDGFIPKFTSIANTTLPVLSRYSRLAVLSLGRASADARRSLTAVDVRGDLDAPMEDLSGGNQQKVLFGRVMLQHPRLLLLDEPTKGVDIGAKREIQDMIRAFVAQSDIAAIVVSSEEEEILGVSDDVVVFLRGTCDGTIYAPADLQPGDLRRLAWTAAAS